MYSGMKKQFLTSSISGMGIVYFLMCFCTLGFSSCSDDYDDTELRKDIDNLENRVTSLEEWQSSVNTNIQSLQSLVAALENRNYITDVTTVMENGEEVGYAITFQAGNSITIRHGKDGIDGKDGADGATPVIGVLQDTDGTYYWTLNGEFLTDGNGNKVPVTGAKGDKGDTGADGANGTNGQSPYIGDNGNWWIGTTDTGVKAAGTDGTNGTNGQSPYIGDNGNWWVGTTDTGVKAAGTDGTNGTNGQSPYIGDNGNWWVGTTDTGVKAAGTDGTNGTNGQTPYIGDNGNWWIGTTDTGVKAAGTNAIAPQVRINPDTNIWEVSTDEGNTWVEMIDADGNPIKATGEQGEKGDKGDTGVKGDAVFSEIDTTSDENKVTFKLVDGTTFTVPRVVILTVKFDSHEIFNVTSEEKTINILFTGLTENNYNALVAELRSQDGTDMDIVTRATSKNVEIAEPIFTNGKCDHTTVTINKTAVNGAKAVLKVTLIDNHGQEISVSQVIKFELNLSEAANEENSTIYLNENETYTMPETIAKGVTIEGNGATITTTENQKLSADGITISNATLSCASTSTAGKNSIMSVSGTGVIFDNVQVTISSNTEYGINVEKNASVTIKNSQFDQTSFSRAVFAQQNANVTLENCDFSANLTYAYNGSGKLTAKNCTFRGWMSGWHQDGVFENCTFEYGNTYYPCAVCYGNTTFKECTFGKYGYPYLNENSTATNTPMSGNQYAYDYWVSCGTANITITFTDCKYSNGDTFGTDIFIRGSGDGKKDPSTVIINGTEYTDIANTFRVDN